MTLQMPSQARVPLPLDLIEDFCHRWRIDELALFGSVLRDDFSPKSDVDVLVTFSPDAQLSLLDFEAMKEDLQEILHRPVDLVSKGGLRNPIRRHEVQTSRQIVYA